MSRLFGIFALFRYRNNMPPNNSSHSCPDCSVITGSQIILVVLIAYSAALAVYLTCSLCQRIRRKRRLYAERRNEDLVRQQYVETARNLQQSPALDQQQDRLVNASGHNRSTTDSSVNFKENDSTRIPPHPSSSLSSVSRSRSREGPWPRIKSKDQINGLKRGLRGSSASRREDRVRTNSPTKTHPYFGNFNPRSGNNSNATDSTNHI